MPPRRSRRPRLVAIALVAVALAVALALLVRACAEPTPGEVLGRLKPAPSGVARLEADVQLAGLAALAGPVRLTLEGPFSDPGPPRQPEADLEALAVVPGRRVEAGVVLARERTYVRFRGRDYAADPGEERAARAAYADTLAALPPFLRRVNLGPFDPGPDARIAGEEEAGGETLTLVEGPLAPEQVLVVLDRVLEAQRRADPIPTLSPEVRRQAAEAVRDPRWSVAVAEDGTVRRASLTAQVVLPPGLREQLSGIGGGTVTLTLSFRDLGRPQRIEPPADPLPAERLERDLNRLLEGERAGAGR